MPAACHRGPWRQRRHGRGVRRHVRSNGARVGPASRACSTVLSCVGLTFVAPTASCRDFFNRPEGAGSRHRGRTRHDRAEPPAPAVRLGAGVLFGKSRDGGVHVGEPRADFRPRLRQLAAELIVEVRDLHAISPTASTGRWCCRPTGTSGCGRSRTSTNVKLGVILRNRHQGWAWSSSKKRVRPGPVRRLESATGAGRIRWRFMRTVTTRSRKAGRGRWRDGQGRTAKGLARRLGSRRPTRPRAGASRAAARPLDLRRSDR